MLLAEAIKFISAKEAGKRSQASLLDPDAAHYTGTQKKKNPGGKNQCSVHPGLPHSDKECYKQHPELQPLDCLTCKKCHNGTCFPICAKCSRRHKKGGKCKPAPKNATNTPKELDNEDDAGAVMESLCNISTKEPILVPGMGTVTTQGGQTNLVPRTGTVTTQVRKTNNEEDDAGATRDGTEQKLSHWTTMCTTPSEDGLNRVPKISPI